MIVTPGMLFINRENKGTYSVLYLSKLKLNGGWVEAVTYVNIDNPKNGTKYTRELGDFTLRFKYVES